MSLEKSWFNGKEKKGWAGFDPVTILKVSSISKIIKRKYLKSLGLQERYLKFNYGARKCCLPHRRV